PPLPIDDGQDVALPEDQVLLPFELHLSAAVLGEDDPVADLDLQLDPLAVLQDPTGADGDDLTLLRLLLGRVGQVDAALGPFLFLDRLDDDPIAQWPERHRNPSSMTPRVVRGHVVSTRCLRVLTRYLICLPRQSLSRGFLQKSGPHPPALGRVKSLPPPAGFPGGRQKSPGKILRRGERYGRTLPGRLGRQCAPATGPERVGQRAAGDLEGDGPDPGGPDRRRPPAGPHPRQRAPG